MDFLDPINIALTIIILINLMLVSSSLVSYGRRGDSMGRGIYLVYLANILTIVWWTASMILYRISGQSQIVFNTKHLYVSATAIASTFYYFSLIFPNQNPTSTLDYRKELFGIVFVNAILAFFVMFGDGIIANAYVKESGGNFILFGPYYFIYVWYILYYFCTSFLRLFLKYRYLIDHRQRSQILYLFIGYSISGLIAFISNLILPWLGIFTFNWLGQVATVCLAISITYAVRRHSLFDMKMITAEFFVFVLWVFTVLRIDTLGELSDHYTGRLFDVVFLNLVILLGLFLIKSVKREAEQNDQNKILVRQLAAANQKLHEVDELKTRFVSLATHHIATPVTVIKGYASLLKEDKVLADQDPDSVRREWVNHIDRVTDKLTVVVRDFLDISQIEKGELVYDFNQFDLRDLIQEVVAERGLSNIIEQDSQKSHDHSYILNADRVKIKQAILNILENSAKYSACDGSKIGIELQNDASNFIIKILDRGERILPKISPVLLKKFSEESNQAEADVIGNGLGVYVAKRLIEGHGGKMSINFDDILRQWCFQIEFPRQGMV